MYGISTVNIDCVIIDIVCEHSSYIHTYNKVYFRLTFNVIVLIISIIYYLFFVIDTVPEAQGQSASSNGAAVAEADFVSEDPGTAVLLSRGLEISSPPTIHQVLDGQPLLR